MRDRTSGHWTAHPGANSTGLLGAVLAVAGLALYVWLVGRSDVVAELGHVQPRHAGALLLAAATPMLLWGISLRLVLAAVGAGSRTPTAVLLFLASVFVNGVTPFGQAGGDPPSGLLIARVEDTEFEYGLAAIASVNALNRLAVVVVGAVGVTWLAARATLPGAARESIAVAVALSTVAGTAVVVGWRRRERLAGFASETVAPPIVEWGERLPIVPSPSRDALRERGRRTLTAVERLGAEPRRLAAAFSLGVAGQVAVVGTLWLSLAALGVRAPPATLLVVVPAAKLSGLVPSPGATGSAEMLLSGLLVAAAGVTLPVATAAALLYRASTFWLPTAVGGGVTAWLLVRAGGR